MSKSVDNESDMPPFEVGNIVRWTSQSSGFEKVKVGEIVAIIPPGERPERHVPSAFNLKNPGMPRKKESYLVKVPHKRRLYWPDTWRLRRYRKIPAQPEEVGWYIAKTARGGFLVLELFRNEKGKITAGVGGQSGPHYSLNEIPQLEWFTFNPQKLTQDDQTQS